MNIDAEQERNRLDSIASVSLYGHGANRATISYSYRIFKRFIQEGPILELGPAEGFMTDELVKLGLPMTAVEGAVDFCSSLRQRYPQIEVVHALFEDYVPDRKYDSIILGHVLEHVDDPIDILSRAREWLSERGRILIAVPNARSLHRQAAVIMGMLEFEEQLNQSDIHHGHRRVYNPETLRRDFLKAGLRIEVFGGYWMKPLSNPQIEKDWSPQLLDAFMELGERYPDIAGELYVVAGL
ncbi:class I SAM-dependent methyltransferase [Shinella sp. S4-D37]|uniref:class I SAM-dependent methyltransferase n=1 Tax=Shinella sp. S4-D37 TaxID=3161999 RepID=UPI0034651916